MRARALTGAVAWLLTVAGAKPRVDVLVPFVPHIPGSAHVYDHLLDWPGVCATAVALTSRIDHGTGILLNRSDRECSGARRYSVALVHYADIPSLEADYGIYDALVLLVMEEPVLRLAGVYALDSAASSMQSFLHYAETNSLAFREGEYVKMISWLDSFVSRKNVFPLVQDNLPSAAGHLQRVLSRFILDNETLAMSSVAPIRAVEAPPASTLDQVSCADYKLIKSRYDFSNFGLSNFAKGNGKHTERHLFRDAFVHRCGSIRTSDFNSSFFGPPHLLLIGTPKGGTTSLHFFLTRGGFVVNTRIKDKESHFFDNLNNNFYNKLQPYTQSFYAEGVIGKVTLDATPSYFGNTYALQNIVNLYHPQHLLAKKFILILREPVSRLYSWYVHTYGECDLMFKNKWNQFPDFHRDVKVMSCVVQPDADRYSDTFMNFVARYGIGSGFYVGSLRRWLAAIPGGNIFIVSMDTLYGDQEDSLKRLLGFLNISSAWDRPLELPRRNSNSSHCRDCNVSDLAVPCSFLDQLTAQYDARNTGMISLINDRKNKPATEPMFLPFVRKVACVE